MRTTLKDEFNRYVLHSGNTLYKLIAVNVAVFIVFGLITVFGELGHNLFLATFQRNYLSLHSGLMDFIRTPWGIITYQFVHDGPLHILFNMLVLSFAGRIFREYLGDRKLLSTYLLSGIAGGLLYMIAFKLIPEYSGSSYPLVGASACILGILAAIGTLLPNYTIYLMFIGPVKLVYLVIALFILDLLSLSGSNAGGHFAHLGGALYGFTYIRLLQNGTNIGEWLSRFFDWVGGLFKPRPTALKAKAGGKTYSAANATSARGKKISQDDIDKILDKIAKSGYESLSQSEKDILFRASNEN